MSGIPVPEFGTSTLPNGMRVVTERIPGIRSVALGVWVAVGSKHEPAGLHGICHYLEHLLFKGTDTRSARQIAEEIESVGGQLNAFTDREFTCYYVRVLADHLPLAVEILSDMLLHSQFDPAELEREKQVIVEELRKLQDSPEDWIHEVFAETVFQGHPLGQSLIGTEETIRGFSRERVVDFTARHYRPDRILVAAAGNVEHAAVVELAQQAFAALDGQAPPLAEPEPVFLPGEQRLSQDTEQVHFCFGTGGCAYADPDRYVQTVLDTVLGGGMSSRLFQEVREKRGLAYHVGSYSAAFHRGGYLTATAGTSLENFPLVLDLIRKEFDQVRAEGITDAELARAKDYLSGAIALAMEDTGYRMRRLATAEMYWGRLIGFEEVVDRIRAVTHDDIKRLAGKMLAPERLHLVAIGPFDEA
jgi:predicted Zn-dependent peptidase